jgi:hypothetical protein
MVMGPIGRLGTGRPQGVIGVFQLQMPYEWLTFDRKERHKKFLRYTSGFTLWLQFLRRDIESS